MRKTMIGKKLLPLVQLLPAAVVAAAVLFTLPRTGPVLAAVPEKLAEPAVTAPASEAQTGRRSRKNRRPDCPMPMVFTRAPPAGTAER